MNRDPIPPRCEGSLKRVPDESTNPNVGWGECPVCKNGFYTHPGPRTVTIPQHTQEKPA